MSTPFESRPKAQEFDIESLVNEEGLTGLFCLSPSTWELAYNLVLYYGYWRSRYYKRDEATGQLLEISDDEYTQVTDIVDLAIRELQMAGCEEIGAGLQAIANALQTGSVGAQGDCGQTVCIDTDTINPDGSDSEPDIGGEFSPGDPGYPEGFDSKEDYLSYKCEAAHAIVDGLVTVYRSVGVLTAAQAIGSVIVSYLIAATAATPIIMTPLGFAGLVAVTLAVFGAGISMASLAGTMADEIETNAREIICRLYEAQNTISAINSVLDLMEDVIETVLTTLALPGALEEVAGNFLGAFVSQSVNTNTVNQLFQLTVDIAYAGADCSDCSGLLEPCGFTFQDMPDTNPAGTGNFNYDGEEFVLSSVEWSAGGFHTIRIEAPCGDPCANGNNWCVEVTDYTLDDVTTIYSRTTHCWSSSCTYNNTEFQFGSPSMLPLNEGFILSAFEINDANPFTITMRILNPADPCASGPTTEGCE